MTHAMRLAWEARDAGAVAACFTADGEFHSPVIGDSLAIRGPHAIAELMRVVFDSTSDIQFTDETSADDSLILRFRTEFNRRPVRGLIWLDLDEDGRVRELWAFVRPLTAVVAVGAAMGPGLASRESSVLGIAARAGVTPLIALAWLTNWFGSLLIRRLNREQQ